MFIHDYENIPFDILPNFIIMNLTFLFVSFHSWLPAFCSFQFLCIRLSACISFRFVSFRFCFSFFSFLFLFRFCFVVGIIIIIVIVHCRFHRSLSFVIIVIIVVIFVFVFTIVTFSIIHHHYCNRLQTTTHRLG